MRRSGYTLMEVLLALAIATLLLAALYVAADVQLRYAQEGRNKVEQSTLSRNIFARITADTTCVIGLSDPNRFRSLAQAAGITYNTNSSNSATTSSTSGSSPSGSTTSGTSTSSSTAVMNAPPEGYAITFTNAASVQVIVLPFGIIGDSQTLNLFVSRVPRELINAQMQQQETSSPPAGDLRRVSYWLATGGDSSSGLARQEVKLITSDDSGVIEQSVLPPNVDNNPQYPVTYIPEVQSLQFEYFDGTDWQDSWDSTLTQFTSSLYQSIADGVTPQGSPVAIRVSISLASQPDKTYRHVIQIMTANGTTPFADSPAAQNTTTSMGGGTTTP